MTPSVPSAVLIHGGQLLLPDGSTRTSDMLLRDGRIVAIADSLRPEDEAEIIDARGHLVLPGLVDTHRHLWLGGLSASASDVNLVTYAAQVNQRHGDPFTTDDIYAGVLWGALQAINAGITSVADWAHNTGTLEHAEANLRALDDSGIRARFFFGGKTTSSGGHTRFAELARALHAADLSGKLAVRTSLGLALRGPSASSPAETEEDFDLARELDLPISIHAGMAGLPGAIDQLAGQGLLGPDVNYAHANEFTPREWDLLADLGGSISATPTVDLTMGLGSRLAISPAMSHGLPVGLGADTVAFGPTDLFTEMRLALAAERSHTNSPAIERGQMPATLALSHLEMLDVATRGGAEVLGLPDVGRLAIGAVADIITIDLTPPHLDGFGSRTLAAFLNAGPADVATVIIDGHILKRDGVLDRSTHDAARSLLLDSRARIAARAR